MKILNAENVNMSHKLQRKVDYIERFGIYNVSIIWGLEDEIEVV